MQIVDVGSDGNCLFRAIAYQLYGDEDKHKLIRTKTMEYIMAEKKYFGSFIEGGVPKVKEYTDRKSCNGIWGDDIEIQAFSEIYDRPIEIYAYSSKPMKTFHEQNGDGELVTPLRLSYHGGSHYNCIVPIDWTCSEALITNEPGLIEEEAISWAESNEL